MNGIGSAWQVPALERALFQAYPTVTVINIAEVLERIESVVNQITFFIRILAGDRVAVELSPYDLTRGRIVYRYK